MRFFSLQYLDGLSSINELAAWEKWDRSIEGALQIADEVLREADKVKDELASMGLHWCEDREIPDKPGIRLYGNAKIASGQS